MTLSRKVILFLAVALTVVLGTILLAQWTDVGRVHKLFSQIGVNGSLEKIGTLISSGELRKDVDQVIYAQGAKLEGNNRSKNPTGKYSSTETTTRQIVLPRKDWYQNLSKTDRQKLVLRRPSPHEQVLLKQAKLEANNFVWNVNVTSRHPQEVQHVIYVKVHKAGSTTIYSLFLRLSISRQLNVFFPNHGNNILSLRSTRLNGLLPHPTSPPFLFDILVNHVVFDYKHLRTFFPRDTRYVAIIREPWQHLQSSYSYFTTVEPKAYLKRSGSFEQYLRDQARYEPSYVYDSLTNNRMSIDLGLPPRQLINSTYIRTFLGYLDSIFDLVLIMERLDESLVLMKRMFHWTMKDIVYKKLNSHQHKNRSSTNWDAQLLERFRKFEQFDVALYDHYVQVLNQKVAMQTPDFQEEVKAFANINTQISSFCSGYPPDSDFLIPATKWSAEFSVRRAECGILNAKELPANSWAQLMQLRRLAPYMYGEQFLA